MLWFTIQIIYRVVHGQRGQLTGESMKGKKSLAVVEASVLTLKKTLHSVVLALVSVWQLARAPTRA